MCHLIAGFGAPATSQPAFGGFGATTTTQAVAPFGQPASAAKPAFGGFGAPAAATSQPSFAFGPTAATAQPAAGGLFGASAQNKPASLSFGAGGFGSTSTAGGTAFGGFGGATTSVASGGGLFGGAAASQPKPLGGGGLFGGTGTTGTAFGGFGGATAATGTAPGAFGSTFNAAAPAGSSFGFGGAATNSLLQPQQLQQQTQAPNPIAQQLEHLTSNPYGDNPLFKHLLPGSGKRDEILMPINPAAQNRALGDSPAQYKVAPHRNIKAKVKPLPSSSTAGGNRSVIFDGLEDDDLNNLSSSGGGGNKSFDLFVPRKSVKKLVLKPKSPATPRGVATNLNETANTTTAASPDNANAVTAGAGDDSLHLPTVRRVASGLERQQQQQHQDESFVAMNKGSNPESTGRSQQSSDLSDNGDEDDDDAENCPAGIVLKRAGYYTIPRYSEIVKMLDSDGNCNVENFTIGREDYGNIFFPGVTNVAGLNLDEIVFIRNKEVIVYPDERGKPDMGKGLNKKAQITLDKVWPVIKSKSGDGSSGGGSSRSSETPSPEKLASMKYEEKLRRACDKLGARFVEYRPETGSWVFRVEHFSKYGLNDSDEEDDDPEPAAAAAAKKQDVKRLKTLQLREPAVVPHPKKPAVAPPQIPSAGKSIVPVKYLRFWG